MSSAKAIIRILILAFVVVVFAAIALLSYNTIALPGCQSCHVVTSEEALELKGQETRTPKIQTEFASHKDLACLDCHVDDNFGSRLSLGARVSFSMMVPAIDGSNFDGNNQFSARCLSCHDQILKRVIDARGIRIKHSVCTVSSQCVDCHATVGHRAETDPEVTFSMDGCMSCHSGLAQEFKNCNSCHTERSGSERRLTSTSWAITHGPDWKRMHGMGDLNSCVSCHTSEMCGRCHGVSVPHPARFFNIHAAAALDPNQNCSSCHQNNFCMNCHGTVMPHPTGFIKTHSAEAKSVADPACLKCHAVQDCEGCHAAHVHPGGSIGTIDGTEESRND